MIYEKGYIKPKVFDNFDEEANLFFLDQGYVVVNLNIDLEFLKKTRDIVLELAKYEDESGDNGFYENRNREEGNIYSENKKLQRVWNVLNKHEIFHLFPLSNNHKEAMKKIFFRDTSHALYTISSYQANILYPGAAKQKIHLDTPVPEPLPPWPVKVTTVNLLDDFTAENGATMVSPKSHKLRKKPKPGSNDEKTLKSIIAPFGSSIMLHGGLWHASGENISNKKRVAILGSYAASYVRDIAYEENHIQIKNESISFNPELEELLGYDNKTKPGATNFI